MVPTAPHSTNTERERIQTLTHPRNLSHARSCPVANGFCVLKLQRHVFLLKWSCDSPAILDLLLTLGLCSHCVFAR
jgi:hypothetical protein